MTLLKKIVLNYGSCSRKVRGKRIENGVCKKLPEIQWSTLERLISDNRDILKNKFDSY
jgi:hypothetical protein